MDERILLVGSDLALLHRLEGVLQGKGYRVGKTTSLSRALWQIFHYSPHLVIVQGDASSPHFQSREACGRIREVSMVPLLVVAGGEDSVKSLEWGADDFLPTSFQAEELLARVAALLRRTDKVPEEPRLSIYSSPELWINFDTHEVNVREKAVKLTPVEFRLLGYLVRNGGRVLTHEQLLEKISANFACANLGTLRQYISRLRRRIEVDPALPRLIITHRGLGYSYSPEESSVKG